MPASPPHATARKAARVSAGCSTASANSCSSRCQRSVGMGGAQRAVEPRPREGPVRVHRAGRHAQRLRGLLDRQAAEEAQLDDLRLARILDARASRAPRRRRAGRRPARSPGRRSRRAARGPRSAAAPLRAPAPRDVDQHPPHHPGRDAEKVPAVLPADRIPSEQAEAQLVDQRGRLQADVDRSPAR